MLYEKPWMEILKFETEDVICASVGGSYDGTDDNKSNTGGSWLPTN